jgi:4a-hydroxytetrahydrobiopterin dehydratase
MDLIPDSELRATLSIELSRWELNGKRLQRTFHFRSFRDALSFVNRVADAAEEMNHHPDIDVRYDKVSLGLSSHDAGGITRRDLALASRIDSLEQPALKSDDKKIA